MIENWHGRYDSLLHSEVFAGSVVCTIPRLVLGRTDREGQLSIIGPLFAVTGGEGADGVIGERDFNIPTFRRQPYWGADGGWYGGAVYLRMQLALFRITIESEVIAKRQSPGPACGPARTVVQFGLDACSRVMFLLKPGNDKELAIGCV